MKFYLLLLILVLQLSGYAQLETRNWFLFQNRIAVTPSGVTTGLPLPPGSTFVMAERGASVSDASGNLLFAVNGTTIIDRNLNIMPALANVSLGASADKLMIQQIPNTTKYYVFYLNRNGIPNFVNSHCTIKYAMVDLSLNAGNGDVVFYNQVLDTLCSPSFTLAQGNDPSKAWLITHRWATDSFYVYPVTSAGINVIPVKSRAGTIATVQDYIFRDLKTSYNGTMFAGMGYRDYSNIFATTYGFVEVFNFNPVSAAITAKVRTRRSTGYFFNYFSLEFSPDNRLLYESRSSRIYGLQPCGFGSSVLRQYNLCYSDSLEFESLSSTIANEFRFCSPGSTWGNIQMGADKRIHMPFTGFTVPTVNFPNRIGTASNYVFNSYTLPNTNSGYVNTPDFHHKLMEKAIKNNIVYNGGCYPDPVNFSITNDTITNVLWNFGDPLSGAANTSALIQPSHLFSAPGIYTVTANLYTAAGTLIETVTELVEVKDPGKRLLDGWPADTTLCAGDKLSIYLHVINGLFQWYQKDAAGNKINSTVADSIIIGFTGKWYAEMRQNDCNGCVMTDSINVTVLPKPSFTLGPDKTICQGDSVLLSVYDPAATFLWSTGAVTNSIWVSQPGLYWLQAEYNSNGCPLRDTIIITQAPGVVFSLPADTTLCTGQTLLLNPGVLNASYLWQNGSVQNQFTVTQPGQYWVKITSQNGCSRSDTINVSFVSAQQVNLGSDTSLCIGSTLLLNAGVPNAQYQWSTGAATQTITVTQSGSYWVKVNNGNCSITDTIVITFNTPPVVTLGNDRAVCANSALLLSTGISNAQYTWSTGAHTAVYTVTQPGRYWVEVQLNGCTVSDTINVTHYSVPVISIGPDTRFCSGDSLTLQAPAGFVAYNWNTGSITAATTLYQPGQYWVKCTTSNGCTAADTMKVLSLYPLPVVNLGSDGGICMGSSKTITPGTAFVNYIWSTGATTPSITVSTTGNYRVTVTDAFGCKGTGSLAVLYLFTPPSRFLPADTAICSYQVIELSAAATYNNYLWSTGAATSILAIKQPGLYWLEVKDNNQCIGRDSVNVLPKQCAKGLFVPTAFTPNGDGRNDELRALLFGDIQKFEFRIYNRYGQQVFFTNNVMEGWDGLVGGEKQNAGSFVWVCKYQLAGQAAITERGMTTLVR